MPVTAATRLCGIVLHPAAHTRSPAMHNAAYQALGIDALYGVRVMRNGYFCVVSLGA